MKRKQAIALMHRPQQQLEQAALTHDELAFARALEQGILIAAAHHHEQPSDPRQVELRAWSRLELAFKIEDNWKERRAAAR